MSLNFAANGRITFSYNDGGRAIITRECFKCGANITRRVKDGDYTILHSSKKRRRDLNKFKAGEIEKIVLVI